MAQIVVIDKEVAELLEEIKKFGSLGKLWLKCDGNNVAILEKVGLVLTHAGEHPGQFARVKALPAAWEVEIRTG